MAGSVNPPKAGEKTAELWRTVKELTDRVNALSNITISPQSAGTVLYADGNITIVLNTAKCP